MKRNWTNEPRYSDPESTLLAAAARWRAEIDVGRLRGLVESLPGPRSRLHAPDPMAATDELIVDAWRNAGWTVERQELHLRNVPGNLDYPDARGRWRDHTYERLDGLNLIAELPGLPGRPGEDHEALVVVAHHDTVRGAPGADDNGAGIAALLELSRLLAGRRGRRTVVLAAPDFEEIGLIGSRYLVPWLMERYEVLGAVVYDTMAYMDPTPGAQKLPSIAGPVFPQQLKRVKGRGYAGDMLSAVYRWHSVPLVRSWARCLAATVGRDRVLLVRDPIDLPLVGRLVARVPGARNFSRSDHVNFWRAGVPAIHVSDTANFRNPHYHQPTDTPDTIDYETLADIIASTASLIDRVAGLRGEEGATPTPVGREVAAAGS